MATTAALPVPASVQAEAGTVVAPGADGCPRSVAAGAATLTAGFGDDRSELKVRQGKAATLSGVLRGPAGGIARAWVCVYGDVLYGYEHALLGIAVTREDGSFTFVLGPGPSRNLTAVYRTEDGDVASTALLQTRVRSRLKLRRATVRNRHFTRFSGRIPGPGNDGVVVVLQVKSGKGWRVFRRYSTRNGGRFAMHYRFTAPSPRPPT